MPPPPILYPPPDIPPPFQIHYPYSPTEANLIIPAILSSSFPDPNPRSHSDPLFDLSHFRKLFSPTKKTTINNAPERYPSRTLPDPSRHTKEGLYKCTRKPFCRYIGLSAQHGERANAKRRVLPRKFCKSFNASPGDWPSMNQGNLCFLEDKWPRGDGKRIGWDVEEHMGRTNFAMRDRERYPGGPHEISSLKNETIQNGALAFGANLGLKQFIEKKCPKCDKAFVNLSYTKKIQHVMTCKLAFQLNAINIRKTAWTHFYCAICRGHFSPEGLITERKKTFVLHATKCWGKKTKAKKRSIEESSQQREVRNRMNDITSQRTRVGPEDWNPVFLYNPPVRQFIWKLVENQGGGVFRDANPKHDDVGNANYRTRHDSAEYADLCEINLGAGIKSQAQEGGLDQSGIETEDHSTVSTEVNYPDSIVFEDNRNGIQGQEREIKTETIPCYEKPTVDTNEVQSSGSQTCTNTTQAHVAISPVCQTILPNLTEDQVDSHIRNCRNYRAVDMACSSCEMSIFGGIATECQLCGDLKTRPFEWIDDHALGFAPTKVMVIAPKETSDYEFQPLIKADGDGWKNKKDLEIPRIVIVAPDEEPEVGWGISPCEYYTCWLHAQWQKRAGQANGKMDQNQNQESVRGIEETKAEARMMEDRKEHVIDEVLRPSEELCAANDE
ncbi:hypothetical protein B0J11DRAFT_593814 [Dendryphion nanum]|uniref:Uncharacterized protein n=1 Tax=Dendryphion nanum TaxID=256645 RepID=A0A9P9DBG1_9PLEO|nr:hypothetical protein B0J11DRAFT_593814 [Dendryphion nanum]